MTYPRSVFCGVISWGPAVRPSVFVPPCTSKGASEPMVGGISNVILTSGRLPVEIMPANEICT